MVYLKFLMHTDYEAWAIKSNYYTFHSRVTSYTMSHVWLYMLASFLAVCQVRSSPWLALAWYHGNSAYTRMSCLIAASVTVEYMYWLYKNRKWSESYNVCNKLISCCKHSMCDFVVSATKERWKWTQGQEALWHPQDYQISSQDLPTAPFLPLLHPTFLYWWLWTCLSILCI